MVQGIASLLSSTQARAVCCSCILVGGGVDLDDAAIEPSVTAFCCGGGGDQGCSAPLSATAPLMLSMLFPASRASSTLLLHLLTAQAVWRCPPGGALPEALRSSC